MDFIIFLAVVLVIGYFVVKSNKDEKAQANVVLDQSIKYYPCMLEGSIDMPDHGERIKARNLELVANGHGVSGDEARDNTIGGGGAPDGGMFLTGSFHFEIDPNGQQIPAQSWVKLFSDEKLPVTGGILPDGTINMGSIGGTQITGSVATGKAVGRILHGDGKHHIYGNLNGGFKLTA